MDEMKIASGFMQGLLTKIVKKTVAKKLGVDLDLEFGGPIKVSFDGEKATLSLDVAATMSKDELSKLLKDLI